MSDSVGKFSQGALLKLRDAAMRVYGWDLAHATACMQKYHAFLCEKVDRGDLNGTLVTPVPEVAKMWRLHVLHDMREYVTFCSQAISNCIWHRAELDDFAEEGAQRTPSKTSSSPDGVRKKLMSMKQPAPVGARYEFVEEEEDGEAFAPGKTTTSAKKRKIIDGAKKGPRDDEKKSQKSMKDSRKRKPQPQVQLEIGNESIGVLFLMASMDEELFPKLQSYSSAYMKNFNSLAFSYKGQRIEAGDTPRSCGMVEGTEVEVDATERLRISVAAVHGSYPIYVLGPEEDMEVFCNVQKNTPIGEILWYIAEELGFGHDDVQIELDKGTYTEDDYDNTFGSLGIKYGDTIRAVFASQAPS